MKIKCASIHSAWRLRREHRFDGFMGMVTQGKQRIGKSSYNMQVLAEAFGEWTHEDQGNVRVVHCVKPNYEEVKKWVVFPPKQFLDLIFGIPIGRKEVAVYWSDAGFWLFVLDWYEPFVKAVARYIQLCARQFAGVFFSSPSQKLISGKVLESMPGFYVTRIIRAGRDSIKRRPRWAKVYERWDFPDGKKGGVRTRWQDKFNCILPDDVHAWYKPVSDKYMDIGRRILRRELERLQKKQLKRERSDEQMEDVHAVVGEPEKIQEMQEVIQHYAGAKNAV